MRLTLCLLLAAALPAQTPARTSAPDCPNCPAYAPISGKVLNALTGAPIPAATIHYRGNGNVFDRDNHSISPTTLQGKVTAGPDGAYTLPDLPPGSFTVRAAAPGFRGAKVSLQPLPVGFKESPPPPVPRSICMATAGKPTCGMLPSMPTGVLRLQPDPLNLQTMSDAALAEFALPMRGYPHRNYLGGEFTLDRVHLRFTTLDSMADEAHPRTSRCLAWTYDLSNGILTQMELPGSPNIATQQNPDLPPGFCNASYSHPTITADQRFSIKEDYESNDGSRGACDKLVAQSLSSHPPVTRTLAPICPGFTYLLDPNRDIILYTQPTQTRYPNSVENIVAFDLNTGSKRTFSVPAMNEQPELLAEQSLPGGVLRVAYTIQGDCDFSASDYSQPGQPDGELGNTPNQFSVCLITIPPATAPTAVTQHP